MLILNINHIPCEILFDKLTNRNAIERLSVKTKFINIHNIEIDILLVFRIRYVKIQFFLLLRFFVKIPIFLILFEELYSKINLKSK